MRKDGKMAHQQSNDTDQIYRPEMKEDLMCYNKEYGSFKDR